MSIFKPLTVLLTTIPLLSGCLVETDSRPREQVIEYDEEVKLHDGSMIWVHIRRHYVLAGGGALGDPGAFKKDYVPKEVEISWDTGFPNVGRKSVFFKEIIYVIDKFNGNWYVNGAAAVNAPTMTNESINCWKMGVKVRDSGCMIGVNQKGEFFKPELNVLSNFNTVNILRPVQIEDWGTMPQPLNGRKISWSEKIELEKLQNTRFNILGEKLTVE